jgi:ABC-type transport system substrate-binding protein
MKHFVWQWHAANSTALGLLVLTCSLFSLKVEAGTRPQYGGTLHVAMHETPVSLDPEDGSEPDSLARQNLLSLIFETLVTVDDRGRVHPGLATEWQSGSGNQRWRFTLRRGVRFHDGTPLTAEAVVSALRLANPSWKVFADADAVIVERDRAAPNLPGELALSSNSIVKKDGDGKLNGTGPFHIESWQPGKHLVLGAEENHWRGRPFLNSIEI